jgi:hypothetical protein
LKQRNFFFKKKLFLIPAYQNDLKKHKKYINLKQRKKNTKFLNFFKSTFETQKQTGFYKTQLKKYVKTASQKLRFKLIFLVSPAVQNIVWFITKHLAAFVSPQTQKLVKNKHNLNPIIDVATSYTCSYN